MRSIIEQVILSGRYALGDMLKKIDTLWLQGDLTDEDKLELVELARSHALPEYSYATVQEQIEAAFAQIADLRTTVEANAVGIGELKEAIAQLGGTMTPVEPEPPEEWPAYKQPTGAHDAYKVGDQITYDGSHYVCKMDGCVWSPDQYPDAWVKQ